MADEDGDIELSHLSWHGESSILSSNPRARSDREASTNNAIAPQSHSVGDSGESSASSHVQQRGRLAPSVLYRIITTAEAGSGPSSSSPLGETVPSTSRQRVARSNAELSPPAAVNPSVSVDDRCRYFAHVVQQRAATPTLQVQAREARIKSRYEAAYKVKPTLDALRSWYDASESERLANLHKTSLWDRISLQVPRLHRQGLPSNRKLIKLVHHYHPPRGEVPIHVCDFGDGRASHSETTLGNIEKCWQEKPDWATVRWIHAPLGRGLTHSSVEDLFRHADAEPWAFRNVVGPSWPYIECEVFSLEHRDTYHNSRDVCILTDKIKGLATELDQTTFTGDRNVSLSDDIEWRAKHVGSHMGFIHLAQGDIGYQLSDGRGAGYNGPCAELEYLDKNLDEQVLPKYPFYESAQIVRSDF